MNVQTRAISCGAAVFAAFAVSAADWNGGLSGDIAETSNWSGWSSGCEAKITPTGADDYRLWSSADFNLGGKLKIIGSDAVSAAVDIDFRGHQVLSGGQFLVTGGRTILRNGSIVTGDYPKFGGLDRDHSSTEVTFTNCSYSSSQYFPAGENVGTFRCDAYDSAITNVPCHGNGTYFFRRTIAGFNYGWIKNGVGTTNVVFHATDRSVLLPTGGYTTFGQFAGTDYNDVHLILDDHCVVTNWSGFNIGHDGGHDVSFAVTNGDYAAGSFTLKGTNALVSLSKTPYCPRGDVNGKTGSVNLYGVGNRFVSDGGGADCIAPYLNCFGREGEILLQQVRTWFWKDIGSGVSFENGAFSNAVRFCGCVGTVTNRVAKFNLATTNNIVTCEENGVLQIDGPTFSGVGNTLAAKSGGTVLVPKDYGALMTAAGSGGFRLLVEGDASTIAFNASKQSFGNATEPSSLRLDFKPGAHAFGGTAPLSFGTLTWNTSAGCPRVTVDATDVEPDANGRIEVPLVRSTVANGIDCLGIQLDDLNANLTTLPAGGTLTYVGGVLSCVWKSEAHRVTIRHCCDDLATLYLNGTAVTNGESVVVKGEVTLELRDFRSADYFRYAPETQTDRTLALRLWRGVPDGVATANPAVFTPSEDVTVEPVLDFKGYLYREQEENVVTNGLFRWNVASIDANDRTVTFASATANLVGATENNLVIDLGLRVEYGDSIYRIAGFTGSPDQTRAGTLVVPKHMTQFGTLYAGSNYRITNVVGLAESAVTSFTTWALCRSNWTFVPPDGTPISNYLPRATLRTIGTGAFCYTYQLVGEAELDAVESIGNQAFSGSGVTAFRSHSPNLTTIGANAFGTPLGEVLVSSTLTSVDNTSFPSTVTSMTFRAAAPTKAVMDKIVDKQTAQDGAHALTVSFDAARSDWWAFVTPASEAERAAGLPGGAVGAYVASDGKRKAWMATEGGAGDILIVGDMTQSGYSGCTVTNGLEVGDSVTLTAPSGMTKCDLQHLVDGVWTTYETKTGASVAYVHGGELTRALWGVDGCVLSAETSGAYAGTVQVELLSGRLVYGDNVYERGSQVRLTASGSADHPRTRFAKWSGDVPTGRETEAVLTLTLTANVTLAAEIVPTEWVYDAAKKTITDGVWTSTGDCTVDGTSFTVKDFARNEASYAYLLDFTMPVYVSADPETTYRIATIDCGKEKFGTYCRKVRFGPNIVSVTGPLFFGSTVLESVEGFGQTRVTSVPGCFFGEWARHPLRDTGVGEASDFIPETVETVGSKAFYGVPSLSGTLKIAKCAQIDELGLNDRIAGVTNIQFLAEGTLTVGNGSLFASSDNATYQSVTFGSTNLVVTGWTAFSRQGAQIAAWKDVWFLAHAPSAASLDNLLYYLPTTNTVIHACKRAPGWKARRASGDTAFPEWEARPAGCWGIYQTAKGTRFYLVACESRWGRSGFTVIVR